MDKRTRYALAYLGASLLVVLLLQILFGGNREVLLRYSEFKQALAAHQLADVVVTRDYIRGSISSEGLRQLRPDAAAGRAERQPFSAVRVDDADLARELQAARVAFAGQVESTFLPVLLSWLLPVVLMVLLWRFVAAKTGGGQGMLAIGKSKARIYAQNDIKTDFEQVAGVDEAVEELREVVAFLRTPEQFTKLGGRLPKGILLVGPPGTGKTLLARAVAGQAKVPFFSLSGSEFVEMFVGVGAARVRDLFEQAQRRAPCIVFIDELDALGRARGVGPVNSNEEREQTLNQLLTEMDGFDPNKGVVLMAATNRPELLDAALLRAGRFDRQVVVDRPDVGGRQAILAIHAARVKLATGVNLAVLAARTPGCVGADLANIVNEAALLAARAGKDAVDMADFEEAIDRTMAGLQKKSTVMTPEEKHRVAIHEAGHALTSCLVDNADPIHKVSIIPRGIGALGFTMQLPQQDRHLYTQAFLTDRLAVLLGGRLAEQIVLGDVSTGAADDLQKATQLARSCIIEFGMGQALGPVAYSQQQALYLPGVGSGRSPDYSAETAAQVDAEVRALLEQVSSRVLGLLTREQDALRRVAAQLEEKETIGGEEVQAALARNLRLTGA